MLPKRGLNIMGCETARFLKLTSAAIEVIPFHVPRKEQSFQADIFPDTYAGVPSMSADEWFAGKNVAGAKKMSLDPAKNGSIVVPTAAAPAASPKVSVAPAPAAAPAPAGGNDSAALAAALAQVAALTKEVASLKVALAGAKEAAQPAGDSSEELEAAKARIAELEASESKLKKAVAALST
jgi:coronin-1B/1C/6